MPRKSTTQATQHGSKNGGKKRSGRTCSSSTKTKATTSSSSKRNKKTIKTIKTTKTNKNSKKQRTRYVQLPVVNKILQSDTSIGRVSKQSLAAIACCVEQFVAGLSAHSAIAARAVQSSQVRVKDVEAAANSDEQFDFVRHLFQDSVSSSSSSPSSSSSSSSSTQSLLATDKSLHDGTDAAWEAAAGESIQTSKSFASALRVASHSREVAVPVVIRPHSTLNDENPKYEDY